MFSYQTNGPIVVGDITGCSYDLPLSGLRLRTTVISPTDLRYAAVN